MTAPELKLGGPEDDAVAANLQSEILLRLAGEIVALRDRIDAGLIPTPAECAFIAAVLRRHAQRLLEPRPKGRGNPNLRQRVDPTEVALLINMQMIAKGSTLAEAADSVSEALGIDASTALKHFRALSRRNSAE